MAPRYNQVNINELAKGVGLERSNLMREHGRDISQYGTKFMGKFLQDLQKKASQGVQGIFGKNEWIKSVLPFIPYVGQAAALAANIADVGVKSKGYQKLLSEIQKAPLPPSLKKTYIGQQMLADMIASTEQARRGVRGRADVSGASTLFDVGTSLKPGGKQIGRGLQQLGKIMTKEGVKEGAKVAAKETLKSRAGDVIGKLGERLQGYKPGTTEHTKLSKLLGKTKDVQQAAVDKLSGGWIGDAAYGKLAGPIWPEAKQPWLRDITAPQIAKPLVNPLLEEYFAKPYDTPVMTAYGPPPQLQRRR